jgi:chromosome segregation ATPase
MLLQFLTSLTLADIVQIAGILGTIAGVLIAYRKLKPEHAKLDAEKQLTSAEAASLITDKALTLLEETEERLLAKISDLETERNKLHRALNDHMMAIQEMEVKYEETEDARLALRQDNIRLKKTISTLTQELKKHDRPAL